MMILMFGQILAMTASWGKALAKWKRLHWLFLIDNGEGFEKPLRRCFKVVHLGTAVLQKLLSFTPKAYGPLHLACPTTMSS